MGGVVYVGIAPWVIDEAFYVGAFPVGEVGVGDEGFETFFGGGVAADVLREGFEGGLDGREVGLSDFTCRGAAGVSGAKDCDEEAAD